MKYIHETVIRDIIDLASEIKDADMDSINSSLKRKNSFKSIASQSSNLTAVFPVIVSRSLNIDNASMVTKAIERKMVSMLQLLFAARQVTTVKDNVEHFKQFHSNLKIDNNISVDGVLNVIDKYVSESGILTECEIPERDQLEFIKKDSKNLDFYLDENINEKSILSYTILPKGKYGSSYVVEAKEENKNKSDIEKEKFQYQQRRDAIGAQRQLAKDQEEKDDKDYRRQQDYLRGKLDQDKFDFDKDKNKYSGASTLSKFAQDQKSFVVRDTLIDSDIKKANELVPTIMSVNVFVQHDNYIAPMTYLIGVKAKMYPVDSMDAINRLALKDKDNKVLTKFIRATTREISFLKDFLFAIDSAKVDALSQSRRGSSSKLWKILERRATKSRMKRRIGLSNDAMAISSLVVSQEEINYIKKEFNTDLEIPEVIRPIMESMNLICFCIVDEINEVSKFIFDTGEDLYEQISFNGLEREASDNSYKKMVNLMSKMTR